MFKPKVVFATIVKKAVREVRSVLILIKFISVVSTIELSIISNFVDTECIKQFKRICILYNKMEEKCTGLVLL